MTASLYETVQKIVRQELRCIHTAELAVVQEQHPHADDGDKDNYACTVQLRDSGMVLKKVPVSTSRIGSVSIPAIGDLVLIQFMNGDINAPVIIGSLYNNEDRPPVNNNGQAIMHLPLGAEDNDALHLELHSGEKREIILKLGKGLTLNLRDDDPVIELNVDDGKASLTIGRDGAISLESQGDIQINGNAINIEAQGDLNLKGATVNLN